MKLDVGKIRFAVRLVVTCLAIIIAYYISSLIVPGWSTPIAIACSTGAVLFCMHRWRIIPPNYAGEFRDLRALVNLTPLMQSTFLPMGWWAMEPSLLLELLGVFQNKRPENVIELGSGVSTILIARLLRQNGAGQVLSIEEDAAWCETMSRIIAQDGLENHARVIHAPLVQYQDSEQDWYDVDIVTHALEEVRRADIVIVDGPKSRTPMSRYPALVVFDAVIDSCTLLILDDAQREYEAQVLSRWQEERAMTVDMHHGIGRSQAYVSSFGPRTGKPGQDRVSHTTASNVSGEGFEV